MNTHGTSSASILFSLGAALRHLHAALGHADVSSKGSSKIDYARHRRGALARALLAAHGIKWLVMAVLVITMAFFLGRSIFDSFMARFDQQRAVHKDQTVAIPGVQPQVKRRVLLVYRNREGRRVRVLADEQQFSAFVRNQVASLEQARSDLTLSAARKLRVRTAPTFFEMRQRVHRFADWYFAWGTSYQLVAKAILATFTNAVRPGVMGVDEAVQYDLERYIERQYRDIVLRPEQSDSELTHAYEQTLADVFSGFLLSVAAFDEAFQDFVATRTTYLANPLDTDAVRLELDWASQVRKLTVAGHEYGISRPIMGVALVAAAAAAGRTGGATAGAVMARTVAQRSAAWGVRGVGARLVAPYFTRLAASAAGAAIGAASGPAGVMVGAAVGLGGDYLFNEGVEFVNRDGLEADVSATVAAQEQNWHLAMLSSLEGAIETWYGDLVQLLVSYDKH